MEETQKRSIFERIFGTKKQQKQKEYVEARLLNSWVTRFTPFAGNAYSEAQARTAVHTFAKRAAIVKPRHVKYDDKSGTYAPVKGSKINDLLTIKANPFTVAYKLFYRAATQYKLYNNAFLYPVYERNPVNGREYLQAIYNINAQSVQLLEYENDLFLSFEFTTGGKYVVPYSDVIHISAHVNENDVFGEANTPIKAALSLSHTLKESLRKGAELAQVLRGILVTKTTTKDEDLNQRRKDFIKNNLSADDEESGGIIVHDNKWEFKQIENKTSPIPVEQSKFIKELINEYYGVNEKIITSTATTEEENAYYNGEILPFNVQLEQALTAALCKDGSQIMCTTSRLECQTIKDKTEAVKLLSGIGAVTLDMVCDIYGLPLIGGEEGKRRIQSLNYAAQDMVDKYQGGGDDEGKGKKE